MAQLAVEKGKQFWQAWEYFCNNAHAFVRDEHITPSGFRRSYATWVKLSGPPDTRWK